MTGRSVNTPRRGVRLIAVIGWISCGLLLVCWAQLMQWLRPASVDQQRQKLTRWWMRNLIRILPLQVKVSGKPTAATALWVSNHVSWLDIVVLGAQAPVHFLSKAEVRSWPVIGWLASAAGTCFIQRGQGTSASVQEQLTSVLNANRSLVIFAEGTTTAGDRVRTFHGRLLSAAIDAQVPTQPVAVAYRYADERDDIAPFIDDDEFSQHLWRLLGSKDIEVEVQFLPLQDSTSQNRNQLARNAHTAVSQALGLDDGKITSEPAEVKAAA
ncbi:lysophospholipid acyltransferase family protein [Halopseudomonas sp.]|uniref:lysophospholipid acyltransferase family protein n=1 Tax=Halopseudomonas sp. TaxID=2901191 RepID=UPI00311E47E2